MAKTITGTLHYLETGQLVLDWGAGNFLALKFTNNKPEEVKTIKVGLDPSQGSGLVPLDEDMNGVFKITDKDTQKFVIESYDAEDVLVEREEYSLAGLVCERPPIHIHFIDHSTQQQISEVEMSGVGSTYDFEVTAENIPEGATLTISSDDTDIITVSEDEYYTITGVAEGSASIVATVTEGGQVIETAELPVDVLAVEQTILIEMEKTIEDPEISYPVFDIDTNTVSANFTALEIDGETPVTTLTANDITLSVDGEPVSSFTFNYDSEFHDYGISFTHSGNTPSELVIVVNYQSHDNEFTEEITAIHSKNVRIEYVADGGRQEPFYYEPNDTVTARFKLYNNNSEQLTNDDISRIKWSVQNNNGVTVANGNCTYSQSTGRFVGPTYSAIGLSGLTTQQIQECTVTIEAVYQGVTNIFVNNLLLSANLTIEWTNRPSYSSKKVSAKFKLKFGSNYVGTITANDIQLFIDGQEETIDEFSCTDNTYTVVHTYATTPSPLPNKFKMIVTYHDNDKNEFSFSISS